MLRKKQPVPEEPASADGLSAFATVSDLMAGLMIIFLWALVVATPRSRPARTAATLTPPTQTRKPESDPSSSAPQMPWNLSLDEFATRQLKLRVREVWIAKFGALSLRGSTLHLRLANGNAFAEAIGSDSIASAETWISSAYGTDWSNVRTGAGCRLGIISSVTVEAQSRQDFLPQVFARADAARQELNAFAQRHFKSEVFGGTRTSRTEAVDLTIWFRLDDATRQSLARRFLAGPGAQDPDHLWCD